MSTGGDGHGGKRAVIAALIANLGIAIAKFVGFAFTASSSMLAEGVHSVADTGNQFLLLLGGRRARKAATKLHPFGYGRERYFWGFIVSLMLFSLGSLFALFEGYEKVRESLDDHHALERPQWALGILGVALVLEALSFRTARKEIKAIKGEASYRQFIRHSKSPELPVVFLEDFGALIGLVLALAAVGVSVATGDAVWDGYGTLAIGTLLGIIAIVLAVEMKSLLIGESAAHDQIEAIEAAVKVEPSVLQLIHQRTEHLGPDELLVGLKLEFLHDLTLVEVAEAIDRLERNIRDNVPGARVIYIEPDVARDKVAAPLVAEHEGHLDHDDPLYAEITGEHEVVELSEWTTEDED